MLTGDARCGGVAFTGSTEVARIINRTSAAKDGPIVPLIAETGGLYALFCATTALREQVVDDVVMSAFRSGRSAVFGAARAVPAARDGGRKRSR